MIIIIRKIGEAQPPKPSARTFAVDGTYGERIPLRAQAIHTDKIRQPWRGYVPPYAVAIPNVLQRDNPLVFCRDRRPVGGALVAFAPFYRFFSMLRAAPLARSGER